MSYLWQKKFWGLYYLALLAWCIGDVWAMTPLQEKLGDTKTALASLQTKLTQLQGSLAKLKTVLSGEHDKKFVFVPSTPIVPATDVTFIEVTKKALVAHYKPTGTFEPRNKFFQSVMGMDENTFQGVLVNKAKFEKSITLAKQPDKSLKLTANGKTFECGAFDQISVKDLQDECKGKPMPGGGTFNVVEGVGTNGSSWFYHHVDVGALQANSDNQDAVFQVASNFNGLETVSYTSNIEHDSLTGYTGDPTQGSAASISAAPGTILRRYLMFYDVSTKPSEWGQTNTGDRKVNFLEGLFGKKDLAVDNGKVNETYVTQAGYPRFAKNQAMPKEDDYLKVKIGYHKRVQVTYGIRSGDTHENIINRTPAQIINQVFTAAVDLGQKTNKLNPVTMAWAQEILNAAYEGTLRKAFLDGKKKVFLTLIGGGVFANDIQWIFNAIDRMRDFIVNSGLEVTVVCYELKQTQIKIRPSFAALVHNTSGTYKQYRNEGIYSYVSPTLSMAEAKLGEIKGSAFKEQYAKIIANINLNARMQAEAGSDEYNPVPQGDAKVYKKFLDELQWVNTTGIFHGMGLVAAFQHILLLPPTEFKNLFTVDAIKVIAYQQYLYGESNQYKYTGPEVIQNDEAQQAQAAFLGTYNPLTGKTIMLTRYSFFYSMLENIDKAKDVFAGKPEESVLKQNLTTLYTNLQATSEPTLGVAVVKFSKFESSEYCTKCYTEIIYKIRLTDRSLVESTGEKYNPVPQGDAKVYKKFLGELQWVISHGRGLVAAFQHILLLPPAEFKNLFTIDAIRMIAYQQYLYSEGDKYKYTGPEGIKNDEAQQAQAAFLGKYNTLTGTMIKLTRYSFFYGMLENIDTAKKDFAGKPEEPVLKQNLTTLYTNLWAALKD